MQLTDDPIIGPLGAAGTDDTANVGRHEHHGSGDQRLLGTATPLHEKASITGGDVAQRATDLLHDVH
eukprot:3031054-Heterocapsa_arctica.AAC.1